MDAQAATGTIDELRARLGFELSDAQLQLVAAVHHLTKRPLDEIALMVEAISRGESTTEFVGMTPEVLNAMEQTGVMLYRNKRYDEARNIFLGARFFGEMHGFARPGAVRGIAACDHSQGYFIDAIEHYEAALALASDDVISRLALAECFCHIGEGAKGVAVARTVLRAIEHDKAQDNLVARAKSIITAQGGTAVPNAHRRRKESGPSLAPQALLPHPEDLAAHLTEKMEHAVNQGLDAQTASPDEFEAQLDLTGDETMDEALDALADALINVTRLEPGLRPVDWVPPAGTEALFAEPNAIARVDELAQLVRDKRITIREIAAFTPDQMEAAYAVACGHIARGDYQKAAQVCGWLVYLDSREPRYYRLTGLCMQHAKMFSAADHYYNLARIWSDGHDAATDIYQGEVALMLGEPERAVTLLSRGVAHVRHDPAFAALVARGTALLKQLAAGQFEHDEHNEPQPSRAL